MIVLDIQPEKVAFCVEKKVKTFLFEDRHHIEYSVTLEKLFFVKLCSVMLGLRDLRIICLGHAKRKYLRTPAIDDNYVAIQNVPKHLIALTVLPNWLVKLPV